MAAYKKRTKQERDAIIQQMNMMRDSGKTYQEIAAHFNLSKQRIYQMIGSNNPQFFRYVKPTNCVYKGIRKWMNDNKISIAELTRKLYENYSPVNFARVCNRLNGSTDISKKHIDKILSITGLTYEVAFEIESEV